MADLVVKTNHLNTVLQNLSLAEIRIMQLAIIDARENGKGLNANDPLFISAQRYAEAFETTTENGYLRLKEASIHLLKRYFSFINPRNNLVSSNWLSQVEYLENRGGIEIVFTPAVVEGITRIDGAIDFFTKYLLSNTIKFKSVYSVRLYELITQFRNKRNGKTDEFPLEIFRKQLGIEPKQYQGMSDFKKYVLDKAVGEINEHSDLLVGYDQIKDGRTITGFCFKFEIKKQSVNKQNNIDNKALLIENLSDKQIARITHSKKFISDYSNMVNPQSPANQSSNSWIEEMSKRLITHPGDFIKRPLQEYLDDEQANRF
ncbi:replication initiation protein RepM [Pseudoduganella danionis]|jgi:plasmid replication initiation protein|uniref:replication initiation protein RepM n=1 Tax=Pseudoduganella danionis TaxID=1890295 RepID=UPI0024ACD98F|nr:MULTISPECIES: replication initiation protein RepM [Moraxella]MDI4481526.1 RepB family plasmid replication initiator protein [Moraxella osloensis]